MSTARIEAGDMREVRDAATGRFLRGVDATVICQHCGKSFTVIPSRLKHGRGRSCSPVCQYVARRALPKVASVTLSCIGCGAEFSRPNSRIERHKGAGKYCTRDCRDAHRIREQHPQFIGRPVHHRGPNWHAQKRKARQRDNWTCQRCGERGNDVHHIRPFRLFTDYREANQLENLQTLCRPCHRKADAEFQAAEAGRG
jgi:5-methylcytosine-specific restriction endonuclease McrA